jgi:hypothetical protein
MVRHLVFVAAAALLAAPIVAHSQANDRNYTYRCVGKDKKKYYGQTVPAACIGQPLELINKQGLVVKRIDPEGEEKERIAKEAEAEKKRELESAQKDALRRNRALLATYTSEKEIEDARARDLSDHRKQVREVENKIAEIKRRRAGFEKEMALYKEGGKGEPPQRLREEITNADIDLKAQQNLLEAKKKDALAINARYDEDRKRYKEAISGRRR